MRVSQGLGRPPVILAKTSLAVGLVLCGNGTICASAAATYPAANAAAVRVQKVQMLSSDGGEHLRPLWSPDSQWLALGRAGMAGIELLRRDGQEWKTLTQDPGSGYKFAWSLDGREIAYRSMRSESNCNFVYHQVGGDCQRTKRRTEQAGRRGLAPRLGGVERDPARFLYGWHQSRGHAVESRAEQARSVTGR